MHTHMYIFISENCAYSFRRFLDLLKSNPRSRILVNKCHSQLLSSVTHTHTHTHTPLCYVMGRKKGNVTRRKKLPNYKHKKMCKI